MKKGFYVFFLIGFFLSVSVPIFATVGTGIISESSSAIDTVFFYSKGDSIQFKANKLFLKLDDDASGDIYIKRGLKKYRSHSNTDIKWLDNLTPLSPGETLEFDYDDMYCFYYSKNSTSDTLIYSASDNEGIAFNKSEGSGIDSLVALASDQKRQTFTTTVALEKTVNMESSRQFDGGSIDGYDRIYAKFLAETWNDSCRVFFATSENGGWDTGNTTWFDRDTSAPEIDGWQIDEDDGSPGDYQKQISTYGKCFPIANESGIFITGSNLLFEVENFDTGADVDSLTVVIIKVKD